MQFSVSSVIISIASATIVIWLISLLLRTSTGYKYFRTNLLLGLSTFVMIRLIMPGELWFVHTLPSKKILPPIYEALNHTIYKNKDIDTKVITAILMIWGIITCIKLYRLMTAYTKAKRILRLIPVRENYKVESKLFHRTSLVPIRFEASTNSPYVFGIFSPTIVMPENQFTSKELE